MASKTGVTPNVLRASDLKSLCTHDGPCITITLPAYYLGTRALPYATNLKTAVRVVEQELLKQDRYEDREQLLAPIHQLAKDLEDCEGEPDSVIFLSPGMFRRFYLPGPVLPRTIVGWYFHLLPFLDQLIVDREFYILGLNEKHLRLMRYSDGQCREVALPYGLPGNAEAAGAFAAPDHMLRDRSLAGHSSGAQPAVLFGTSLERERAHERLHEFFRLVDQGLSKILRGEPLLISGVDYEVAIYRRASAYRFLMEDHLAGDLHDESMQEIARRVSEYARVQARKQAEKQLRLLRETAGTRTSFDIHRILKAAEEGRVSKVILGVGDQAGLQVSESASQEGLLNAIAVLSIRSGSEVFTLPASAMAPTGRAAASLRY